MPQIDSGTLQIGYGAVRFEIGMECPPIVRKHHIIEHLYLNLGYGSKSERGVRSEIPNSVTSHLQYTHVLYTK